MDRSAIFTFADYSFVFYDMGFNYINKLHKKSPSFYKKTLKFMSQINTRNYLIVSDSMLKLALKFFPIYSQVSPLILHIRSFYFIKADCNICFL